MPQLVRGLGLWAAISLNVANTIGTGVFLKARVMTCNVGDPVSVMAVWLAAGLLVLAGALTYSELTAMMPEAGGEYVILRETYGPRWGFLYGWTYTGVSRAASLAAQAFSGAIFLNIVTGGMFEGRLVLVAMASIVLMAAINSLAVSATGRIATVMTVIKIGVVASVGIAAFVFARGDWGHYAMTNLAGTCVGVAESTRGGFGGFSAAMLGALWGYQGWQNLAAMAGEVRDPQRNISRGYVYALLIVGTLYLFANASYFHALTPDEIASVPLSSSVATEVLAKFLGPATASLMAMGLLVSSLGALHASMAGGMRIPYAMARDGLYFQAIDHLSPRTNVPVRSAMLLAAISCVLALMGNYDKLTDAAIFSLWSFYGLTAASVFILRKRRPDAARPYRTWGYPVVPGLFLAATAAILISTVINNPSASALGIAFTLAGLPFYWYWSKRKADAPP
jgi:basic amino acid/polyamine antiporter, APA family